MWWMPASQAALAGVETGLSYEAQSASAKAQKKFQTYRNNMIAFSAGEATNDVTTNVSLAEVASVNQSLDIEKNELQALGSAKVSAAAAGVKGNSVNATENDIQRNAANQQDQRIDNLNQTLMQADQQKRSISINEQSSFDLSPISQPNLFASGVSLLGKDMDIWDHYQENGYIDNLRKSILG